MTFIENNNRYWSRRAESYAAQNEEELASAQKECWRTELTRSLKGKNARILDVGTGPGFFAVLLAEAGYCPDAVDANAEMLALRQRKCRRVSGADPFPLHGRRESEL